MRPLKTSPVVIMLTLASLCILATAGIAARDMMARPGSCQSVQEPAERSPP